LVVESVASFVEDTVKGDHEIGFIVAGGHAGVARSESRAEGVGTGVETTSGDVETDFREEGVEKLFLQGAGVVAPKIFAGGRGGQGKGFSGDGNKARAKFGEKSGDVSGEPSGFVAFKERVVGLVSIAPEIGHLSGKGKELFEVRRKGCEVGVFAGLDPSGAGEADGEFIFLDEFGGDASSPVVVVSPAGDGGGFGSERREGHIFALIEPTRDVVMGSEAMGDASDEGGLFGAKGVAFGWKEGFLVPSEQAAGGAKEGEIFPAGAEFFVGVRKRGHAGMMKQDGTSWNVFL
jgi:hypothetical protein